ncbi:hypothetical protein DHD05_21700 [Arenibacter sp. N53]|nr:hypothetical protein [Arenibacter sp. N53]
MADLPRKNYFLKLIKQNHFLTYSFLGVSCWRINNIEKNIKVLNIKNASSLSRELHNLILED